MKTIERVAVLGGGLMGSGSAEAVARAGLEEPLRVLIGWGSHSPRPVGASGTSSLEPASQSQENREEVAR